MLYRKAMVEDFLIPSENNFKITDEKYEGATVLDPI